MLEVVSRPSAGTLFTSRGKTRPIVVFLAVAIAFCALAFVLENLRLSRPAMLGGTAAPSPATRTGPGAAAAEVTRAQRAAVDELKPARETCTSRRTSRRARWQARAEARGPGREAPSAHRRGLSHAPIGEDAERGTVVASAVAVTSLGLLTLAVVAGQTTSVVAPALALGALLAVAYRGLLTWPMLVGTTIVVVLFVPIRRYRLPGDLPFELEPYRLLVALIVAGWLVSLLVDTRLTLRRSGFEAPIALIVVAISASLLVNPLRVEAVEPTVVKKVTFFARSSFSYYVITSSIRIEGVELLVRGARRLRSIVAAWAVVEARTGYNIFDHLGRALSAPRPVPGSRRGVRGGRLRVFASAQHPIALGAMFVMLIPLAIYLCRRSTPRLWGPPPAMLGLGRPGDVSRTSVVMLRWSQSCSPGSDRDRG